MYEFDKTVFNEICLTGVIIGFVTEIENYKVYPAEYTKLVT